MRAICVKEFGAPQVLKLVKDLPIPKPNEDQVLVRIKSAGVNPVDTYIRSGTYARKPSLPYTPGTDIAGEVVELGSKKIENFLKIGQRVFSGACISGSYSEYGIVPASLCFPLADHLTFEQGAAVGVPGFTAYRALFIKGQAKPGETVLIHGASGAVGLLAVQLAVAHGMTVFGTAGSEEGLKLVAEQGAHGTFNHKTTNVADLVKDATNGKGVDLILEMLADKNLEKDCQMAANRGKIVIIGSRGSLDFAPRLTMGKELVIQGVALFNTNDDERKRQGEGITAAISDKKLKPHVGKIFSLEDAKDAHEFVINTPATLGKVVLTCDS